MGNGFEDLDLGRLRRRRSEKWQLYPADVLPAFIAEMDYDLAEPVLATLREAVGLSDCGYAALPGIGPVFAAFAQARHEWTVDPDRVHLIPDVMAGVDALLALATEPGDGVVVNTPVYPPFFKHIGFARRRVVEVPLVLADGRWELDFAVLEAAFAAGARGYLLCSPHNPTGRVFSAADLSRIAALAERYGVLVIADEIHASLTLPGARHTPFVSLGGAAAEHGVTLASASKAFNVAGLKGAVAVAGSAAMERLLGRLPESCHYGAGLFGVLASLAAWDSGGAWLDALIRQLDHARAEFGRLLGERLPGARYIPPEASYLAWVDCSRLGLGPEPARVFLDRGRVALGRGLDFGAPGDGYVRVTIGTSSALLAGIADRMAAAVLSGRDLIPGRAGGSPDRAGSSRASGRPWARPAAAAGSGAAAGEQGLALHAGQPGTQAVVRPGAEAQRRDQLPGHVERLGLPHPGRVPVRGGDQAEDHAAGRDLGAGQLGRLQRGPGQPGQQVVLAAVAAGHRVTDLAHVQAERDERHTVGTGQAAEHRGRGQHVLVAGRPQPDRQGDERLNVTLRSELLTVRT